ncbi:DUF721 domain-containing protein [Thiorhodovibrio frisius]|uniref:DciA family protein n=1 Tax=Thiorhodovibrio frisius TaxID=631362 RepID=UPI0002EC8325|nr:DciA family protein [Thiorhodovibrio frisius]
MHIPTSTPVPRPADWARIHGALLERWRLMDDPKPPVPPKPLILAGAAFSSAWQVRLSWTSLVEWANTHGFGQTLADRLPPPPDCDVAERISGIGADGSIWWQEQGEQDHPPARKPSRDEVCRTLERLATHWPRIVGEDLARRCKPRGFYGRKRRRLAVVADPTYRPPWGDWSSAGKNPRAFTTFRAAINAAIEPMGVDEVSFHTAMWQDG